MFRGISSTGCHLLITVNLQILHDFESNLRSALKTLGCGIVAIVWTNSALQGFKHQLMTLIFKGSDQGL